MKAVVVKSRAACVPCRVDDDNRSGGVVSLEIQILDGLLRENICG